MSLKSSLVKLNCTLDLNIVFATVCQSVSISISVHSSFLLLAHYVPNAAKRNIWDQCKKKYILRTNRPTNLSFGKISNGHMSARGRPIHFMFGSRVGFSALAGRIALILVWPNSTGMWEKTMREELLDWSQSKVFLVRYNNNHTWSYRDVEWMSWITLKQNFL